MSVAPSHGGLKVDDLVTWADSPYRVTHLYEGCDEIVIQSVDDPTDIFDQLYWSVEKQAEIGK